MGVFKKNGSWWIDFYHSGKRIRRKVGNSKKMAETALADIQVKQAKKEFLGFTEPKKKFLKELTEEYLEYSKANKAKSSHERDLTIINNHFLPAVGDVPISKITAKTIEQYKVDRLKQVLPTTVNRELNTIKNMFRKTVEWGDLREAPTTTVKKIKTGTQPFRFLSEEEIQLVLKACAERNNPQFYGVVVTALNTGMRKGEIVNLEWNHVDLKRGVITVSSGRDGHTKNYETRTIPINKSLRAFLEKHPRRLDSQLVFASATGKPFSKTNHHFLRAVKRLGIPHVRFHDLRHTFASHLVMKGVDLRTVQELLGHKDLRMTMKYAHLAPDHMRKAVEVLDLPEEDCSNDACDGHYLDTEGAQKENQDAADEHNILTFL